MSSFAEHTKGGLGSPKTIIGQISEPADPVQCLRAGIEIADVMGVLKASV